MMGVLLTLGFVLALLGVALKLLRKFPRRLQIGNPSNELFDSLGCRANNRTAAKNG